MPGIKFHLLLIDYIMLIFLFYLQFYPPVSAIRKGVNVRNKLYCRSTVHGRFFLSDDNGYVCDAFSVDPLTRCCPGKEEKFSCKGCNLISQCCNSYEYCVSCCLNPIVTPEELALKVKIAKPVTAGYYESVFDFCAGRCRHNSASVVHENAYQSEFHHCFSISSNFSDTRWPYALGYFNNRVFWYTTRIKTGWHQYHYWEGESCDIACKSNGQSCVPNKLSLLNQCEVIQKYMKCKGACFSSIGADQPAEVVDDAPRHLNPGACLFTRTESIISCDGSHSHTRRLCPCA